MVKFFCEQEADGLVTMIPWVDRQTDRQKEGQTTDGTAIDAGLLIHKIENHRQVRGSTALQRLLRRADDEEFGGRQKSIIGHVAFCS